MRPINACNSLFGSIARYTGAISLVMSRYPVAIIWWATSRCDARCLYCENSDVIKESSKRRADELTIEELAEFSKKCGKIKIMAIGGGEPTLRVDLADVVNLFYSNNHLEIVNLYTNGFSAERLISIAEGLIQKCPAIKLNVFISIDAVGEKHQYCEKIKVAGNDSTSLVDCPKALYVGGYLYV